MTPKEKSKELVNKYFEPELSNYLFIVLDYEQAKQCALIAVDEILDLSYFVDEPTEEDDLYGNYWQEVKQEIEKL